MKPISVFFPRVLPYVPGCSEPLAQQALVDAAIVFCEESQVIRARLDGFSTVPDQVSYELDAPAQQQVARILEVRVDGRPIPMVMAEDVGMISDAVGRPMACYTDATGSEFVLRLFPIPDGVYQVQVSAALRPSRDATSVEDDLFNLWSDALVSGALARLMAVPAQPFSNPALAGGYSVAALSAARKARVEGSFARVRGSTGVTQRPFA
jgi:hypothetical protein